MSGNKEDAHYRLDWKTIRSDWPVWFVLTRLQKEAAQFNFYIDDAPVLK